VKHLTEMIVDTIQKTPGGYRYEEFNPIIQDAIRAFMGELAIEFRGAIEHAKSLIEETEDKRAGYIEALKYLNVISGKRNPDIPEIDIFTLYLALIGRVELPKSMIDLVSGGISESWEWPLEMPMGRKEAIQFLGNQFAVNPDNENGNFKAMFTRLKRILKKIKDGKHELSALDIDLKGVLPAIWE